MRSAFASLLLCLVIVLESPSAEGRGEALTPFTPSPYGGVVVDVMLDDHGPFQMIVDTGSTHSVITTRVAAAIGARAVAQVQLSTSTGSLVLPVASDDAIQEPSGLNRRGPRLFFRLMPWSERSARG